MMADNLFKMPKGRQTIRKNGGRRTRLWELSNSNNNPTIQKLEAVYLSGLDAMDRTEATGPSRECRIAFT
jgi:hypothetical protein